MPEQEVTAAQICAYWNALVLDHDVREMPLEADLAATIQRLHALNIEAPASARHRVRDRIEATIEQPYGGARMSPAGLAAFGPSGRREPAQEAPGASPAGFGWRRVPGAAFVAVTVLILVLAAASLPFITSRLSGSADEPVLLSAVAPPQQDAAPVAREITGGDDPLETPAGIAVGADGAIYVIDVPRDQIRVFNADGSSRAAWGKSGDGPGEFGFSFDFPWGDLAFAPDGNLYVLDPNLARIQAFTPDGTFLFGFGERGSGDGQILYPMGIGVGPNGQVYVADWQNHRVQVFDGSGAFVAVWDGTKGGGAPLAGPTDVAVDAQGTAWVSDDIMQRIFGFAPDGTVVASLAAIGDGPGEVRGPRSVAMDADGNIYVTDYGNDRVEKFAPDGNVLGIVGSSGEEPGQMSDPTFLALGPDNMVYVTEEGTNRIQAFPADALIPPNILTP